MLGVSTLELGNYLTIFHGSRIRERLDLNLKKKKRFLLFLKAVDSFSL